MNKDKNNTKKKIAIAALLHHVKYFWQRANRTKGLNSNQAWEFSEPFKSKFESLEFFSDNAESYLQFITNMRQNPSSMQAAIINMAHNWATGFNTKNDPSQTESALFLHSIFNKLKVQDKEGTKDYIFKLKKLTLAKDSIFPTTINDTTPKETYYDLWNQFAKEFSNLPTGSFNGFLISALHLLQKYTWCIPLGSEKFIQISLFEHAKTMAGFASCFYKYWKKNPATFSDNNSVIKLNAGIDPVLMCCIDLSGIQKFIYDIVSAKAFQSLKGRSFYLQLLLNNMLNLILSHDKIRQTPANIIYNSGGMAYFMLPNTTDVKEGLEEVYEQIKDFVWEEHKGKIFPALGWVSFRYEFPSHQGIIRSNQEKGITDLGQLWRQVSILTNKQKRCRFNKLMMNNFDEFFSEKGDMATAAQTNNICYVTGEPIIGDGGNIGEYNTDKNIPVLLAVEHQTKLGKKLKDCNFQIQSEGKDDKLFHTLNRRSNIVASQQNKYDYLKKNSTAIFSYFNDTNFLNPDCVDKKSGFAFSFYGGNKQPEMPDPTSANGLKNKTFEELCAINQETDQFSKLGVLRMDVDNLGLLFKDGFDSHHKSFSGYATLSFLLKLFFSGYINTIWKSKGIYKEHVSILYSGGDDLFAVGRWDALLDFTTDIKNSFSVFTGRTDLTLSAGIVIVDKKYPIYKAAAFAGAAETQAKEYKNTKLGHKNACCFFNEVVSWNEEFDLVKKMKTDFVSYIHKKWLSRSLLHQIQYYKTIKDHNNQVTEREKKAKDFSYIWHSAYYMKRFGERHNKQPKEVRDLIHTIQKGILTLTDFCRGDRYLDLVAVAARWAEYELRILDQTINLS